VSLPITQTSQVALLEVNTWPAGVPLLRRQSIQAQSTLRRHSDQTTVEELGNVVPATDMAGKNLGWLDIAVHQAD
jgi:hypothetical protein